MEELARGLERTVTQDIHIIRQPSPSRDIATSTSADRGPVSIIRDTLPTIQFSSSHAEFHLLSQQQKQPHHNYDDENEEDEELGGEDDDDDDDDEIVSEICLEDSPHPSTQPKSLRPKLPPIPDLRFEQSYLKQL